MRFVLLSLLVVLLVASTVAAAPQIDAIVSGSFNHGSTVSISGGGFGVKSPVEPLLWDTVDNQASYTGLSEGDMIPVRNDGCTNCPWQDNIPDSWGMPPFYSEVDMRASHPNYRVFGKGYFRSRSDWDVTDDIMVNYWMKVDATPGYYDGSNGNFKFIRLYADSGGFSSNGGVTCSTALCSYTSDAALTSNTVWRSWGGNVPDVWHHIEITADDHSSYTSGNGEFNFYVDNRPIFQFTDVYANAPLKLFWILGFDSLDDWHTYLEDASMDWTEIYVDNTLAKIAIGDAPVWSDVSHWEVQIPQNTWNNNNIEFEVNLGSFTSTDGLYLFVIDENGDVSNGKSLSELSTNPTITSVDYGSGLVHGNSYTINGVNFGTKSPVEPVMFSDFEEGSNTLEVRGNTPLVGAYRTSTSGGDSATREPTYSNQVVREGSSLSGRGNFVDGAYKSAIGTNFPSGGTPDFFTDARVYTSSVVADGRNTKYIRAYSVSGVYPNGYLAYTCNGDGRFSHENPDPHPNDSVWGGVDLSPEEWHHVQFWVEGSSVDQYDGSVVARVDNQLKIFDTNIMTRDSSHDFNYGYAYWGDYVGQAQDDIIGCDAIGDSYMYFDDIYFDITRARIELCDASSKDLASNCEIQIPVSGWDDGTGMNIDFTANLGSFSDVSSDLWLFVIDEDGVVSNAKCVAPNGCSYVPPPDPVCGDGSCNGVETQVSCPSDCGSPPPVCDDDGRCDSGETLSNCPSDCGSVVECFVDLDCDDGVSCTVDSCVSDVCFNVPSVPFCSLSDGLELYLPFDNSVVDLSGRDRSFVSVDGGVSGYGISPVDGFSAYFSGGALDFGLWDLSGDSFTLSSWVRVDAATDSSGSRFVSKASSSATDDHFWMLGEFDNQWRARLKTSVGDTLGPVGSLVDDVWYHVVTVYDGSSWSLFVDGSLLLSVPRSGDVAVDSSVPVFVGSNSDGYGLFRGALDDLRVYDRALSVDEVSDLYAFRGEDPAEFCGDGFCNGGDDYFSCSADCSPTIGDFRNHIFDTLLELVLFGRAFN